MATEKFEQIQVAADLNRGEQRVREEQRRIEDEKKRYLTCFVEALAPSLPLSEDETKGWRRWRAAVALASAGLSSPWLTPDKDDGEASQFATLSAVAASGEWPSGNEMNWVQRIGSEAGWGGLYSNHSNPN